MPKLRVGPNQATPAMIASLRCPACHRLGSFHGYSNIPDLSVQVPVKNTDGRSGIASTRSGIRICPNPACQQVIFISSDDLGKFLTYPPERIDFDTIDIPERILSTFEEAITNHANSCFRSAAIMVRRTLEEICADRSASGPNLKERLKALGSVIIVPQALLDAADELRILGNEAAHLEARVYDDVGHEEIEIGIGLAKEILKAVYQLSSLVEQLRKLKK